MIIYWIIIFISFFLLHFAFQSKKRYMKIIFSVLAIIIPSLLAAFRDITVGTDVGVYGVRVFNQAISAWSITNPISFFYNQEINIEKGYILINLFVAYFSSSYHILFFVLQFITLSLVVLGCWKLHKEFKQSAVVFLFYMLLNYAFSFNILRQSIAIGLFVIACNYFVKRKFLSYFFILSLGFFFHNSIMITLPFYFIPSLLAKFPKIPWTVVCFIIGTIFYMMFPYLVPLGISIGVLDPKYIRYANESFNTHKNNIAFYVLAFSFVNYFLYFKRNKILDKIKEFRVISAISISAIMIEMCGVYNDVASRVSMYLFILNFILVLKVLPKSNYQKFIFNKWELLLIVFMVIYFTYNSFGGLAETIPYRSKILGI